MKKLLVFAVGLSLVLMSLSGCGPRDEKTAFVEATIEATCYIFEVEDILAPEVEIEAKAIYAEHGFNVDDEVAMEAIALKYAEDETVQEDILAGIEACTPEDLNFGDGLFEEDVEVVEEEAVEGEEVVVEGEEEAEVVE